MVDTWPLDALQRAKLERLRGQIGVHLLRCRDAPLQLLKAARQLESLDIRLARETYLEVLYAQTVVWPPGSGLLEVAQAARVAPPLPPPRSAADMLLDGLAVRFTDGYVASAPILKLALSALREQDAHGDQEVRWLSLALRTAADLFDDETWHQLVARQARVAHPRGCTERTAACACSPRASAHLRRRLRGRRRVDGPGRRNHRCNRQRAHG
jgi:hypothetical protein